MPTAKLGWIVVLNGAPRSGKSSIAAALQDRLDDVWINLGVDVYQRAIPALLRPSIGLRPGGERPDIEARLPVLFAALYESVAAHSRLGLHVVVDIGHHDAHSMPIQAFEDGMRRLEGLPVLVVGVRCPLATILHRRSLHETGRDGVYERGEIGGSIPAPILAWQQRVHVPGLYDLEIDTSEVSPGIAAARIANLRSVAGRPFPAEEA